MNTGLGMGKGKIGAQCAHAAVGVYAKYYKKAEVAFRQWEMCGQAKIALKARPLQTQPKQMPLLCLATCR